MTQPSENIAERGDPDLELAPAAMDAGQKAPLPMPRKSLDEKLQQQLDRAVTRQEIPGATACLLTADGAKEFASGLSRRRPSTPMRPRDRFRIASISKLFVATAILRLVEEGQLDLKDRLADRLPESMTDYLPNCDKITLRHLLSHTSGLDDYLSTEGFSNALARRDQKRIWHAREAIGYIYNLDPLCDPGAEHHYSNSNYLLLEVIVEEVTGKTLAHLLRTMLLDPLKLADTYTELYESQPGGFVEGYEDLDSDGDQDRTSSYNGGAGLGDGGLISTAYDLADFAHKLFGTKEVLASKTLKAMLTWVDDGEGNSYGLGVTGWESDWGPGLGHGGYTDGFRATLWYLVEHETAMVVLINDADNGDPDEIAQKLLETYFAYEE